MYILLDITVDILMSGPAQPVSTTHSSDTVYKSLVIVEYRRHPLHVHEYIIQEYYGFANLFKGDLGPDFTE